MYAQPIAQIGLLLVLFRVGGLVARYLVQPAGSLRTRLALFVPATASHIGALLVVVSLFLSLAAAAPGYRQSVAIAAGIAFLLLMVAGQADLTVSSITGAPLTPTVFRTFRGIRVVTSNEFLEPLRANIGLVAGGVTAFAAVIAVTATLIARGAHAAVPPLTATGVLELLAAGLLLAWLPALAPWPVPPPSIEAAFAREYLRLDRVRLRESEADAIAGLRALVGLPPDTGWVSDDYPLVYGRIGSAALPVSPRDLDIVVVMAESLRAEDLTFVVGAPEESVTPHLDRLADQSVVFPMFISNGFPSAPSVLAFHCSAWPHRRKEIITDFSSRCFDSLPARLRGLGWDTVYVGADPHFDNQVVWLSRWYETAVDLVAGGSEATDRAIVSRAIDEIRAHDERAPNRPLFAFVSTYSTHYPFTLPGDAGERPLPPRHGLRAQYRQVLRYTDGQIGRLLSTLAARPRADRTVIIVLGDHGFYADLARTSGLPANDTVWTAAIVAGPSTIIGAPRQIAEPASHVDLLPTILALVGDNRPSAAVGRNLLGPQRSRARTALSIRPGGLRLDRGGRSMMIDARTPNVATTAVAFPGLLAAPPPIDLGDVDASRLERWVDAWSYLIESDRVWNESLMSL